ncbi:hypothetical protein OVY01_00025 [Robbsia sp. Bb-Pol-6]|uniref:Uncharacterized protein n=1 Tax=Robbsia betulipollinis TaxID=2981849 RepID=A0ABT3ZGJ9_9BURK|nr:hypothetical protein [Robbsia betulipollinis]MCY0385651.1 hypothetical protein [Robbsia betulipollinis]
MKVTTNRPILHGGNVSMNIVTTDLHARELAARGLIGILPRSSELPEAAPPAPAVPDARSRGKTK